MQNNWNHNHVEKLDMEWEGSLLSMDEVSCSDSKAVSSRNCRTLGSKDLDFSRIGKFGWKANVEAKASAYYGNTKDFSRLGKNVGKVKKGRWALALEIMLQMENWLLEKIGISSSGWNKYAT